MAGKLENKYFVRVSFSPKSGLWQTLFFSLTCLRVKSLFWLFLEHHFLLIICLATTSSSKKDVVEKSC